MIYQFFLTHQEISKRIFYIQKKMDFDEHEIIEININNDSN